MCTTSSGSGTAQYWASLSAFSTSSWANYCCLVTGGLGGVGSEVVISILQSGGDVICLDLAKTADLGRCLL